MEKTFGEEVKSIKMDNYVIPAQPGSKIIQCNDVDFLTNKQQ